jgi:hypothetical protein
MSEYAVCAGITSYDVAVRSLNVTSAENCAPFHAVNRSSRKDNRNPPRHTPRPQTDRRAATKSHCSLYGFDVHTKDKPCPAKGKQYDKCKKFNNFASMCRSTQKQFQGVAEVKTHDVDFDSPVFDLFTEKLSQV